MSTETGEGQCARVVAASGSLLLCGLAHCQVTSADVALLRDATANHIEALAILGGDYGLAGADFKSTGGFALGSSDSDLSVRKFGGSGDVGDPKLLGSLAVGWQPRLQGNMGWLDGTQHIDSGVLGGDRNRIKSFGIEFGGGVRFWLTDQFSVAPTIMGLYGNLSESYTANSVFMRQNFARAAELGLINWKVDTVTVIPRIILQYLITWDRSIITLSTEPGYYRTESFNSSNSELKVKGGSTTWVNMIDIDTPLGMELFGHELRTGGFYKWTGFYGDLKTGLNVSNLNELHGRLVLDVLNQLWKVKWLGIGASYLCGPHFSGWSAGLDAAFRF